MTAAKHPDYRWIEVAIGGITNRNHVISSDQLQLPDVPKECFSSIFRFPDKFKEHVESTKSVKGLAAIPCYADYLWFDIDDSDLKLAFTRTRDLIVRLQTKFNIQPSSLRVYFSGKKGFHVGIDACEMGWQPSVDLAKIARKMAVRLAGEIKIDTTIYEQHRLLRLPGSIHGSTGMYKVAVDHSAFLNEDGLEAILEQARVGTSWSSESETIPELNPALEEELSLVISSLSTKPVPEKLGKNSNVYVKPCIEKLLKGVDAGIRNEAAIRLAVHFKRQDMTTDIVGQHLEEWNQKNSPPLESSDLQRIVESAFANGYDYGCNDPILLSLCQDSCKFKKNSSTSKSDDIKTSFRQLTDGRIVELVYRKDGTPETLFAVYKDGVVSYEEFVTDAGTGKTIRPFKADSLMANHTILFPYKAESYGTKSDLLKDVTRFIERYLTVSPFYLKLASYYVLLTWVYDNYKTVPYLRALGDYGTGKSRLLKAIGSICYKPTFCQGAATTSPIFRMLDRFQGTLVIDEADFAQSDESARLVKIFNSGFQFGTPVLLSIAANNDFKPTSFNVYGPKIIATRRGFMDQALESRCLTEHMDGRFKPGDAPIELDDSFEETASQLRNMLLMFRFHNFGKTTLDHSIEKLPIEPRLAQILMSIFGLMGDEITVKEREDFIAMCQERIVKSRRESLEGWVAEAYLDLVELSPNGEVQVGTIADEVNRLHNRDIKGSIPARRVGEILRVTLQLTLKKRNLGTVVVDCPGNIAAQKEIKIRYGLTEREEA